MISSNFVGCWIGRSAGLAPLVLFAVTALLPLAVSMPFWIRRS